VNLLLNRRRQRTEDVHTQQETHKKSSRMLFNLERMNSYLYSYTEFLYVWIAAAAHAISLLFGF
jgi:hypothetical protein